MSINLNLSRTFSLLLDSLKYNVMISIIVSSIALFIICILNEKVSKYIIITINVLLLFLIGKYYIKDIFSFEFSNPLNNMYFYFFNSVIFMIIFSIEAILNKLDKYDYIFNSLFLIFISFSIFMTHYLVNILDIVIYNIYPMIKCGNILILVYYLTILTKIGYHVIIKKTSKRSGKL